MDVAFLINFYIKKIRKCQISIWWANRYMFQQSPESNLFSHVWCRITEGSYRQVIDEFQTKISEKTKFNQRFIYYHGNSSVLEQWNSFVSYFLYRANDTVQDNDQGPILHNESTLQFQNKYNQKKPSHITYVLRAYNIICWFCASPDRQDIGF